jgi:undecaprenyl-diphosphatase
LPAVAVALGLVLLGLLVTHVLAHGWLARESVVDQDLVRHRTPTGNAVTHVFTYLAETPTVIALTALAAVGCRVAFRRWHEAVFVVLAVTGETLIFLLTTLLIDRRRPAVPPLDDAPPTSSFPSGHTAAALCLYGAVAAVVLWHRRHPLLRALAVAVAILVPLLVGASRLYRGMHFPSDVAAGLLLGVTWLSVTTRLVLLSGPGHLDRREAAGSAGSAPKPREAVR